MTLIDDQVTDHCSLAPQPPNIDEGVFGNRIAGFIDNADYAARRHSILVIDI